MSDLLKRGGQQIHRWWPIILRCAIYFLIASIPDFLKEVHDFWKQGRWAPIQINTYGFVSASWAGLVAIRAFLDTFSKTHSDELKADDKKKEDTQFFGKVAP